jgi:phosphoribosylcarboxyaminoimidazole (NCAIR) mutase
MTEEKEVRIIHVKVIDGSQADIYAIAQAFKKLTDFPGLPFKLQAIVTNDHIVLQDVDTLIKELYKLKKQIDMEKSKQ